jgi:hypothetical protein
MGIKKELAFVLYEPKKNSIRYNQVLDSKSKADGETPASFYIPNWILDNTRPKVLKITIEEVSE